MSRVMDRSGTGAPGRRKLGARSTGKAGWLSGPLPALVFLAGFAVACNLATSRENSAPTDGTPGVNATRVPATPKSELPAAGICAEAEGPVATMRILPGIPDPRCLSVRPDQLLQVANQTEMEIEVVLAGLSAVLAPGEEITFDVQLGALLLPGVHSLSVAPCCGGELWLKGDETW